jgi:hypothetical protein
VPTDTATALLDQDPLPDMPEPPAAQAPAGALAAPGRRPPKPEDDPKAAPNGWTWDSKQGAWRPRRAAGRPRSVPRVTAAAPPASAPPRRPAKPTVDYRTTIMETAEFMWLGLSTTPIPDKAFGYDLSGVRVRVRMQAAALQANADKFAEGLATIAEHAPKSFLAKGLARMAEGKGGLWVLPAAMLVVPLLAQTVAVWTAPLDGAAVQVADAVEAQGREYFAQMTGAMADKMAGGGQGDAPESGAPDAAL